jgi:FlaA1/EpsC-like NDP-sugar epimerase
MKMSCLLLQPTKWAIDVSVLFLAYALAYVIRFEGPPGRDMVYCLVASLPFALALKLLCLAAYRVPRLTWRYVGLLEAQRVLAALGTATPILVGLRLLADRYGDLPVLDGLREVPLGVLAIDLALSYLGAMAARASVRLWQERLDRNRLNAGGVPRVPTLLIGAGTSGALVAKELEARPDLGIVPVGFLDDDVRKRGTIIQGVKVLGTTADLGRVAQETRALQALITIQNTGGPDMRRIVRRCEECRLHAKIIPGIHEIAGGHINLSRIRDVAIEDILRREPVKIDAPAVAGFIRGRTILVTGAGGSIASELCRKLCGFGPGTLLLVEQAENNLFYIHRQLTHDFPDVAVVPFVADICDGPRMEEIFAAHRPEVVFHAAAHKHVPLMEWNPGEAVKNNVLGTRQVARLADAHGVREFVMISTDKAVNTTSVMGVTKRVAEICLQTLSCRSSTRFVTVRFGNVLGSTGSVIPIFREQIARGGPVTVTHPEMRRYMMTIPEACELVLQAASMGQGGEIFILDMGEPVKIVDLAREMIRLSGLTPEDIEIRFTGIRPGEKLFEELTLEGEMAAKTANAKIFIGRQKHHEAATVERQLRELEQLAARTQTDALLAKLGEMVPEYTGDADLVVRRDRVTAGRAFETARALTKRGTHRGVPSIAVSNHADSNNALR